MQEQQILNQETKDIMIKLVTSLLASKPQDPVPHIYSYLNECKKGTPTD